MKKVDFVFYFYYILIYCANFLYLLYFLTNLFNIIFNNFFIVYFQLNKE